MKTPEVVRRVGNMPYRRFGATGLEVSEIGFGAWAIGGKAYGAVERQESLRALARAEELGCNFVDTAAVYGDSEQVLGEFLKDRRSRWRVATKFSRQPEGMTATLQAQLRRLGIDAVDFYQIHWAPGANEQALYEELYQLKRAGKARFVGVSLYSTPDIDYVLDHTQIDGLQVAFSLLDPSPFLTRLERLQCSRMAVIVRSSLKEGFLTGKFTRDAVFPDPNDQRHQWSRARIAETVVEVEQLRFLEQEAGSMLLAAASYPLSFATVSTVILGTKSLAQADSNFGRVSGRRLSAASIARITELQRQLGLGSLRKRIVRRLRALMGRIK